MGMSHLTYPHFDLSSRYAAISPPATHEPVAIAALHLPMGAIAFAAIVRLQIAEVRIAPRRPDWQQIVAAAGG